ncbi:MAG: cinA [Caulobacteraceae bacterium]|jgi:nicotinamide-nucleotide amidase|nr:cinA [Caulobacteraceae bacterium]
MAEALDPILPGRVEALTRQVLTEASLRGFGLATAESCTGGLLASLLTDVPGASHAFDRGFVVYTDAAKAELLGVDRALLKTHGAVSEPVARAMAEGALRRSAAEIALSITGWAEGAPGHPAGLVHFASARRSHPTTHRVECFGDIGRARLRIGCLEASLEMMLQRMAG